MKKSIAAILAAVLIITFCASVGGCTVQTVYPDASSQPETSQSDNSGAPDSVPANSSSNTETSTESKVTQSEQKTTVTQTTTVPTKTDPPKTDPPKTDPPKTDPPKTDPPKTDPPKTDPPKTNPPKTDPPKTEKQPVGTSPSYVPSVSASGKKVAKNGKFTIDYSNADKGYVMVKLNKASSGQYKVLVQVAGTQYTYNLDSDGSYAVIPMTMGNNTYTIYAGKVVGSGQLGDYFAQEISVTLSDSMSPWLTPNAYCMYSADSKCVKKASQLCGGFNELEKVEAIYKFVIKNTDYVPTAESSADGYVPYPDRTYSNGWGICFDYASLMAAMLRSQKIPTKIVVGYAGSVYHAWLSVYVTGQGWVDGIIRFNGNSWTRMDPTFLDDAYDTSQYQSMVDYVANSGNYTDYYYY